MYLPLVTVVMPENCQLSKIAFVRTLSNFWLRFGTSYE